MSRFRTQITGQRAQNRGAVGEKFHRLIGLQPLRPQDLKDPASRLGIHFLHEAKAFGAPFGGSAFARNHLGTAFFMPVLDAAAVEADYQRAGRTRQDFAVAQANAVKRGFFKRQLLRLDHRVQVLLDGRVR